MALIKPILGELKGSIGGNTFQGSRFGQMVRQRTKPVNPDTPAQGVVRAQLAAANVAWISALTPLQRDEWESYAANTPWTNRFGDTVFLPGRQMFIRTSVFFQAAGGVANPLAPVTPGLPANPDFTLVGDTAGGVEIDNIQVSASGTDAIGMYVSDNFGQQRNFFKGPFVSSRFEPSNVATPLQLLVPAQVAVGQRYFVGVRYLDDSLRLADQILIKPIDILV